MPSPEQAPTDRELSPLVEVLTHKFVQRWDKYPIQLADGRYVTVHEPLHVGLLFAHLRGEMTLGTYLLNPTSEGRFLVLDADSEEKWHDLQTLAFDLAQSGNGSYLEQSRRGGHLWLFFGEWQSGENVRAFGKGLLANYGLSGIEIYPKQDQLEGPGSLIRLPFGLHQVSRRRYGFITPDGQPLASSIREQLLLFQHPQTVLEPSFWQFIEKYRTSVENSHLQAVQRLTKASQKPGREGVLSERLKAVVSVRAFVEQYVPLSEKGRGLCPFHDDHHPSFSVNEAENYWCCWACNTGGSIIDFWMKYQGIDFTQAVRELADMVL